MIQAMRTGWHPFFTLAAGMALVLGAYGAEPHGEAPADHAEGKELSIRPTLKPNLKADAQGGGESRGESSGHKSDSREGREGKDARESREGARKAESASEAKPNVSMAELRDLIDQKIAEVRTKREPPAVVRLRPKPVVAAKRAGEGPAHGTPTNDAHGALLPDAHGHDVHWAYSGDTGPDSWGRLKPEFQQCMLGKRQSPIDIRDGIPVQLDPIQFDYRPTAFRVVDNGHTVQVNVEPGNSITVSGRRYELVQFHFHRPSEERINGRQYEMVAHLVHKDLDGRLAVVAVLMDQGKAHPAVQQVWNNLPLEKNSEQPAMTQMDLNQLLPEQRQYYTYMGSLTTPPCTEGVLWMVMKQPAGMSREQIGVFAKLYPMNARPVQSASGRLIKDGQ